jgi:integrating conjugative element protein (TIGR03752 family)
MLITNQNRLLPILATIVGLLLLLVLSKSCTDDDTDDVMLDSVPQASAPDADTPADTIKTLTANVAAMTAELQALREANASLGAYNEKLLKNSNEIEKTVAGKIEDAFASREEQQSLMNLQALSSLSERVDAVSEALTSYSVNLGNAEIPVGLGLEDDYSSSDLVWIEPLEYSSSDVSDTYLEKAGPLNRSRAEKASQYRSDGSARSSSDTNAPKPVYTVPRNATLMGSTAMTALLGRVPVRGEVRDPMPFKVITGHDNLAANGLSVPGVEGMIWSGTAIGDWTLSCVTGRLESVTFVFDDGSIRTISSDDREDRSADANRPLGWISDARGIPCVSGQRKSNAAAFLTQRIGVKAIEAASEAAAASQTTTVIRDSGAITSNVGGDSGAFILGKTLADGSNEIAQWLLERQAQNFDAVFVPAGAQIAIHVDRELSIDLEPNGRRLSHATSSKNTISNRLD